MESVYRAYKDSFELFADIAEIIRQEASNLATMGCVYIQIDAPNLLCCSIGRRISEKRDAAHGRPSSTSPETLLRARID